MCDRKESEQGEPNEVVYNYELKFDEEGASVASFRYKHGGVWQDPINEENLGISIGMMKYYLFKSNWFYSYKKSSVNFCDRFYFFKIRIKNVGREGHLIPHQ